MNGQTTPNIPMVMPQLPARSTGRRVTEAVVALALLMVSLPLGAIVAGLSAATFRANPIFRQQRVGLDGELFTFVKFRTLDPQADAYATKYDLSSLAIPRTMRVVRRLHLDEIPQLVLVVLGTMSLVGPRPEMPNLHEGFCDADAALRTSVPPGITGLWQISRASAALISETPHYDRFYLRHRSLRLDLWIVAMTVRKVFVHRTVHLADVPAWAATNDQPLELIPQVED